MDMWNAVPWTPLLLGYASMEVLFFLVYALYLKPRANRRTRPQEYRDYEPSRRHLLLKRILDRMERTCHATHHSMVYFVENFLVEWFANTTPATATTTTNAVHNLSNYKHSPPALQRLSSTRYHSTISVSSSSSPEVSSDEEEEDDDHHHDHFHAQEEHTVACLKKQDTDDLLAWAFFAKPTKELVDWEERELSLLYQMIRDRCNVVFAPGRSGHKMARRLNLEDVRPMHRPLLVYGLVYGLKVSGSLLMRWYGFRRQVTSNGLVYWHRAPAATTTSTNMSTKERLPLLFFHGIAPGGLRPYLPMLLWGIGIQHRHVFLFENPPISCTLSFGALTEDETVAGVAQALDRHLPRDGPQAELALCGHSFGSCPLTWILKSKSLRHRIRQFVLIDPVTILLSEPDVMVNFLYSSQMQAKPVQGSLWTRLVAWARRVKIQVVASSELFTEHYLRRHFSWYNSELWLEDIPSHVQVLVCLSEMDEILHAGKVRKEIELHNARAAASSKKEDESLVQVDMVYWEGVGHAHCITSPPCWQQIVERMDLQEKKVKVTKSM